MTACIYYHPEGYTTSGPKLMGRNAAGESFLRGFLSYGKASEFWVQVQQREHGEHFLSQVRDNGRSEPVKMVDGNTLGALSEVGVVYYPGPGIGEFAFQRSAFGHGAWSLCGITHTTSSASSMDALADLIASPVQPWDAVICTSIAVKDNVSKILQAQADYLEGRLGVTKLVLPQLPVIPLGIHCDDFVFTDAQRTEARQAVAADDNTLVAVYMGRLSFHAKAHPLAMYLALEQAAQATGKSVVLIECGWHANDFIENAFAEAAALACPNVRVVTLDGRLAESRQTTWASADVFCSLADNIQETFGIVPIEAMAAGVPVVVADWDGYKDTVRDGVDGFRIPTLMPQAGLGHDLAFRHAMTTDNYDMYCGHTCSLIAVDIEAATDAFEKLFDSHELREQMGEAGRQRATEVYDWRHIIARYETLWAQLDQSRLAQASDVKSLAHPWPARMDPFYGFSAYPTHSLNQETRLTLAIAGKDEAIERVNAYNELAMVNFAKFVLPTEEEIVTVIEAAEADGASAIELVATIPEERQAVVMRSLSWLVKLGVFKLVK
ncbi:MAG: glycosyltransferase family 4 protein [Gammaproteobacteria bacterium]|jgi:glycosyltransferase involved in cell wall biosynthesis|nr:glycosyltransferase family 4 protein [Gammaproteobacteria bacterium]